jgi:p-hydroxybenzoate 3-monooxygenase
VRALRTQVVIIGAGPAGLLLGRLLDRDGIDNVIVERRSRDYVEQRVRAGVIEFGIANFIDEVGAGERMRREGLQHRGVEFRVDGVAHRIALGELTDGKYITVYGQQELVKDLIELRARSGGALHFDAEAVAVHDVATDTPSVEVRDESGSWQLTCDYIAGCDGSFGVAAHSVPAGAFVRHERSYPFSWLGILAEAPPASEELIYSRHERGFALYSMRTPTLSRLYLGVSPNDTLEDWPDDRIWEELSIRLTADAARSVNEGPILERSLTTMRSAVLEPMRYGRLVLAGDAAHIVPPTGAKGMNLALADVRVLAGALADHYAEDDDRLLDDYSTTCLDRVWRAEEFSNYMTQMLHPSDGDGFENGVQRARLRQVVTSREAATVLARNYVDLNSL